MNLLKDYQSKILDLLNKLKKNNLIDFSDDLNELIVEIPPKNNNADISCNAAMILAKFNKKSPIEIATFLKKEFLDNFTEFKIISIAKPGFININFSENFWKKYLQEILKLNNDYGSERKIKKKYNIEFVSANPTGPLHVGHCRGAILGDVISNLLKFNGHNVLKEYYVNDYGNQINSFVDSVYFRILEIINKQKFPINKNLYPGDYIIDIAKEIINDKKFKDFTSLKKIYQKLTSESLLLSIKLIKKNLQMLGIKHDNFVYESDLVKNKLVDKTVEELKKKKFVYEGKLKPPKGDLTSEWKSRSQLIFNSTKFGDDVDRALQKEDRTWTYFAGDIAYHAHKVNRKFDYLVNILGADHAGYIKRIQAAVKALSSNKTNLTCKLSQLVKLYKDNKPFKMSKREGNYITVDDLIKEVGKDSVRFMMLSRSNDVELDFDFKKVTEKSKDNPIYYVQYAYARINSVFKNLNLNINENIVLDLNEYKINEHEINILKKIAEFPKCIEVSTNKLEPHRIPFYLYDLATLFHSYWSLGQENKSYRFISDNGKHNQLRLQLIKAASVVIENGMTILGVSTPKSM